MKNISSAELDQNPEAALIAALEGPVFIHEEGQETLVLLSIEEYERLKQEQGARKN